MWVEVMMPNQIIDVLFWVLDWVLTAELEKGLDADLEQFGLQDSDPLLCRIVKSEILRAVNHQLRVYPRVRVKGRHDWDYLPEDTDTQVSTCAFDTFADIRKVNTLRLPAIFQEDQALIHAAYQLNQYFVLQWEHKLVGLE
jgi:hypothetical protein